MWCMKYHSILEVHFEVVPWRSHMLVTYTIAVYTCMLYTVDGTSVSRRFHRNTPVRALFHYIRSQVL
jgi:hypothetical protein